MNSFQLVSERNGLAIEDVAYVMVVSKSSGVTTGPATITMSAPASWVAAHGGMDHVRIERVADDGTVEILETRYVGVDPTTGNLIFEANSPNGLSQFGLIMVKALVATPVTTPQGVPQTLTPGGQPQVTAQPTALAPPQQAPAKTTTTSTSGSPFTILIIGAVALVVLIGVVSFYTRQPKKK
jgi:hypothetical protein